jgi:hypothetical protein
MTHPLLDNLLEVDCAAANVLRAAGSTRQREHLRDALADMRRNVLVVVAHQVVTGDATLDIELFRQIVAHAHRSGLNWADLVAAFETAQGSGV